MIYIHFTIRTKAADSQDYQFTSQFFFDDTLTDQVPSLQPYASRIRGTRSIIFSTAAATSSC
jgi:hypothetical protein